MMKILVMLIFLNLMMVLNKMIMFYYNLCYMLSLMMLFMYMSKDMLWYNITLMFGLEFYSILLGMLSLWIIGLMMMCLDVWDFKVYIFINMLLLLIMFFLSMDLMIFYLLFEVSLIPTFFLIIYWGSNMERLSAAYYLMIYMLMISFPLLIYIMKLYLYSLTLKFSVMNMYFSMYEISIWGLILIYMSFFIKMPMYMVHMWLPKAHVEAPVYGSMILAGILLKMGSFGLIRLMDIFIYMNMKYIYLIFSLSIVGALLISILCLVQIDMKSLVAYSSVVHMNLMLSGMMTMYKLSFVSSYILMISHGLCSSGLFYMVNIYYHRSNSRLLVFNKGMLSKLPTVMMWWFMLSMSNFSFPFSLNFFSEVFMLSLIMSWDLYMIIYLMMICFFSSAYSLYLFSYVMHGMKSYNLFMYNESYIKEILVMWMHYFPLMMLLLNLIFFM